MARKAKAAPSRSNTQSNDFSQELIEAINKERGGDRIAFNLSVDAAPTNINSWLSTASEQLDIIVANRTPGGVPEGRIIEIFGPTSIGKSHLAVQIAKTTQTMGGIVVYIDTENATSVENLQSLGINIAKKFVFIQETCIENIFDIIEKTIVRARGMNGEIPVTVVWDSIAASTSKAELEGDYDHVGIALSARAYSKGFRKITNILGSNNVTLVCLNQVRVNVGQRWGDQDTPTGGRALPFYSSVRIKLTGGSQIKNKFDEVVGINVIATTIKNKVAPPFRKVRFEIIFGQGIQEHEQMFDLLRAHCADFGPYIDDDGFEIRLSGTSAWKTLNVQHNETGEIIVDNVKFHKSDFKTKILDHPGHGKWVRKLLAMVLIRHPAIVNTNSFVEVQAALSTIDEQIETLDT